MKAIETRYAGCLFRLRLEARWAVFFDHLGIEWEHEPQGYVIDDRPYLPDFRLLLPGPEVVFAEVKNIEVDPLDGEHVEQCRGLARATGAPVILLTGAPHWRPYNQVRAAWRAARLARSRRPGDNPLLGSPFSRSMADTQRATDARR
jgi:hypothetical protein